MQCWPSDQRSLQWTKKHTYPANIATCPAGIKSHVLQCNKLCYAERIFLPTFWNDATMRHSFHTRGIKNILNACTKEALRKTDCLKKTFSSRCSRMIPSQVTKIVIRHLLINWKNSARIIIVKRPLPATKRQQWSSPGLQCRCRLVCKRIRNDIKNWIIVFPLINCSQQYLSQLSVIRTVQYNHLPTLQGKMHLLVLRPCPSDLRQFCTSMLERHWFRQCKLQSWRSSSGTWQRNVNPVRSWNLQLGKRGRIQNLF